MTSSERGADAVPDAADESCAAIAPVLALQTTSSLGPLILLVGAPVLLILVTLAHVLVQYSEMRCWRCPFQERVCTVCRGPSCSFTCELYASSLVALFTISAHVVVMILAVCTRPVRSTELSLVVYSVFSVEANWVHVTQDVVYGAMLISAVFFPVFAYLTNQGIFGGFTSYLVVSSGHSCMYAALWAVMHSLLFWVKACLIVAQGASPGVFGVRVLAVLALVVVSYASFQSVIMSVLVLHSAVLLLNIGWKWTHPPSQDIPASPRRRLRRRIIWWISGLIGVFMLIIVAGAIQGHLRQALVAPEHFRVSPALGTSAVSLTQLAATFSVDGTDAVQGRADFDLRQPSAAEHSSERDGYVFCSARVHNLTLVDYALFSLLPYFEDSSADAAARNALYRQAFFPDFELVARQAPLVTRVQFLDLYSAERNLSVIAVRGTGLFDMLDWVQDLDLWVEAGTFQFFSLLFPGLNLWPTDLVAQVIKIISNIDAILTDRNRFYHEEVVHYVRVAMRSRSVVVVGHSLGGGIAKIVGASVQTKAVAFAAPSIVAQRKKLNISLDSIAKHVINVAPTHDITSLFGEKGGCSLTINCLEKRPDMCHLPMHSACDLISKCGHPRIHMACDFSTKAMLWPVLESGLRYIGLALRARDHHTQHDL